MANVNNMAFNQLATLLTTIVNQATGVSNQVPTDTSEFISIAQTGLKTGYDPLATAISQVLSRTIFSVRPYTRKFKGLERDAIRWGNHVRKLTTIDKPFEEDDRLKLVDGESIDQYRVNKPKVVQTNFYGANQYQKSLTIYRDQLDTAFSSADEFGRFISMILQNASDQIEQAHEELARETIANYIKGVYALNDDSVTVQAGSKPRLVYLYDEFEAETGLTFANTAEMLTMFYRWLAGFIVTITERMEERTVLNHLSIGENAIMRHTPKARQKMFMYQPFFNNGLAVVASNTFHDNLIKFADFESVGYWQSTDSRDTVNGEGAVMSPDGTIAKTGVVTLNNILGVIVDEETLGYTTVNQWSANSPFNARGGYYNMYWHFTDRYYNDYTENGIVLLLDKKSESTSAIVGSAIVGISEVGG